jgi:hypothetical protein
MAAGAEATEDTGTTTHTTIGNPGMIVVEVVVAGEVAEVEVAVADMEEAETGSRTTRTTTAEDLLKAHKRIGDIDWFFVR